MTNTKEALGETLQIEKLHIEEIVNIIRHARNNIIKGFLYDGNTISDYFHEHYRRELSLVKKKFIYCELSDLLISPIDLAHYSFLIREIIMETNRPQNVINEHKDIFYKDLEIIFDRYKY